MFQSFLTHFQSFQSTNGALLVFRNSNTSIWWYNASILILCACSASVCSTLHMADPSQFRRDNVIGTSHSSPAFFANPYHICAVIVLVPRPPKKRLTWRGSKQFHHRGKEECQTMTKAGGRKNSLDRIFFRIRKKCGSLFGNGMKKFPIWFAELGEETRSGFRIGKISLEVELRYLQFGIATFRDLTASCLSQALLLSTVTKAHLNLEVCPVLCFVEFNSSIGMRPF